MVIEQSSGSVQGARGVSVSVIVTAYNWSSALSLTLESVVRQSARSHEVIVADDGSGKETAEAVEEVLGPSDMRWCHIWHDHKGVRQSRIKNLAVRYSRGPYLIFVDQDTILHTDFVSDHLSMARKGVFLQGKRVLLPKDYTDDVLNRGCFEKPSFLSRELRNRKNLVRCPFLGKLLARPKAFQTSLRGCNLSIHKEDFLKVDGFDETFDGSWGREDSDICYRLFNAGLRIKNLWFSALQYHLYHEVTQNWQRERLDGEIKKNLEERRTEALKGYSQLSTEGGVIDASNDF